MTKMKSKNQEVQWEEEQEEKEEDENTIRKIRYNMKHACDEAPKAD